MRKSADAFRTISEVAQDLDLPQHVLRFWETRFSQIKPMKRGGGRRYYRPDDIDLLRGIRHLLYDEGYTIKGVQKILKEQGVRHVIDTVNEAAEEDTQQNGTPSQEPSAPASPSQEATRAPASVERNSARPVQDVYQQPHTETRIPPQNLAPTPVQASKAQPAHQNAYAAPTDHQMPSQQVGQPFAQSAPVPSPNPAPAPAPEAAPRAHVGDVNFDVTGQGHTAAHPKMADASQPVVPQAIKHAQGNGGASAPQAPAYGGNAAPNGIQGQAASQPSHAMRHDQNLSEDNQPLPPDLRSGDPQFLQGGRSASLSIEEARLHALQEEQKSGFFSRFIGGRTEASEQDLATMTHQSLSRDEIRRLQSTLFELLECKRILDQALAD